MRVYLALSISITLLFLGCIAEPTLPDEIPEELYLSIETGSEPYRACILQERNELYVTNLLGSGENVSIIDLDEYTTVANIDLEGNFTYGIEVDPNSQLVYVAAGDIHFIDPSTREVVDCISIGGSDAFDLEVTQTGEMFVSGMYEDCIYVIDLKSSSLTDTISCGSKPNGIVLSPDDSRLFVTCHDADLLEVINTSTHTKIASIPVGRNPVDVCTSLSGDMVYVTCSLSNSIYTVGSEECQVVRVTEVGWRPNGLCLTANGDYIYAACSREISVVHRESGILMGAFDAPLLTWGVTLNPQAKEIYTTAESGYSVSVYR